MPNIQPTDLQLQESVLTELKWDPSVKASDIGVAVRDGTITVSGVVNSFAEKLSVEAAALRVRGGAGLVLDLTVRLPQDYQRDDAAIAAAAVHAIAWNSKLPAGPIRPVVENGWITLTGEVCWEYQSRAATDAVARLFGVKGVNNQIRLRACVATGDIRRGIHDALVRQADQDSANVHIRVHGATVTLNGTVRSWAEREAAALAAWGARGVAAVVNDITVRH